MAIDCPQRSSATPVWLSHRVGVSVRDVEDLLAHRGAARCPTQRPGCGASRLVQSTRASSRVDRAGWTTSGPWTRASSPSRASGALSGVPSIKRVTSSIAASSRVATVGRRHACSVRCCRGRRVHAGAVGHRHAAERSSRLPYPDPSVLHGPAPYANNRVEMSHQPTRHCARHLRWSKSPGQAQQFLSVHGLVRTLFRGGRHLVRAVHHRERRRRSFLIGDAVTIAT